MEYERKWQKLVITLLVRWTITRGLRCRLGVGGLKLDTPKIPLPPFRWVIVCGEFVTIDFSAGDATAAMWRGWIRAVPALAGSLAFLAEAADALGDGEWRVLSHGLGNNKGWSGCQGKRGT